MAIFKAHKKKQELKNIEHDVKLFKNSNHVLTHDNFYEKYIPIRIQAQISETLKAVLGGKERRRLELYDNDKNSLLYQSLLVDDGSGHLLEQMRKLHAKAFAEVESEDKRKQKELAVKEAV